MDSKALAPVRDWLRESGATHITLNTRRGARRYTVDYALAKVRTLGGTSTHVHPTANTASIIGPDLAGNEVQLAVLSHPVLRRRVGWLPDGKPDYEYDPC